MMNYFSNRKKWMAYLILLTFVFTCIVPTNLAGGNSEAWAAGNEGTFTVQYYAELQEMQEVTKTKKEASNSENLVPILDTNVYVEEGILNIPNDPTGIYGTDDRKTPLTTYETDEGEFLNNGTYHLNGKYLVLNSNGTLVKQSAQSTKIFADRTYSLNGVLSLDSFDQVTRAGENYELIGISVSENGTDWTDYDTNASFTKDVTSSGSVIALNENSIVRLLYKPTSAISSQDVDFYDYNIMEYDYTNNAVKVYSKTAEGTYIPYTGSGDKYYNTSKNGINTALTNNENAKQFAFGSVRGGYGDVVWKDDILLNNRDASIADGYSFSGATFGLVTGLDENGNIVFDGNIVAPDLFGEQEVTGKKAFSDFELNFARLGDTYTLKAVTGTNISNLDKFENPEVSASSTSGYKIWTNNFWPMDNIDEYTGKDILFGNRAEVLGEINGAAKLYNYGFAAPVPDNVKYLPISDDYKNHNSYFGMHYTVDFSLTDADGNGYIDYTGPLNYYFFGDNDMWVLLSPKGEPEKAKVVCDLGGAHSSVAAGVNLWDFIDYGVDVGKKTSAGDYTLHIFYLERGASGSTCFMQYTLPSVKAPSGDLRISKTVVDATDAKVATGQAFEFNVTLDDNKTDVNKYDYTIHNSNDGSLVDNVVRTITTDSNADNKIELKDGQYAQIHYLPVGTTYKVTEAENEAYTTTVNGVNEFVASGTIEKNVTDKVDFVNTLKVIDISGKKIWSDIATDTHEDDIVTINLLRDGELYDSTTVSALNWEFDFGNLPKHEVPGTVNAGEDADGHEYIYQVQEVVPDGYIPSYHKQIDTNGNQTVTITNHLRDDDTPRTISGEKIWADGKDGHNAVMINLFGNDKTNKLTTTTTSLDMEWKYSFSNLPKYDNEGNWINYTVEEVPVDGYVSNIVPTVEGFDIYNTPYVESIGQVSVGKVVTVEDGATAPSDSTEYEFNLLLKAEYDPAKADPAVAKEKALLEKAKTDAETAHDKAEQDLQDAWSAFDAEVKITSPSAYEFIMVSSNNTYGSVTSPSVYVYELNEVPTNAKQADATILNRVKTTILNLATKFKELTKQNTVEFMEQFTRQTQSSTPSAIIFSMDETNNVLNKIFAEKEAKELKVNTADAYNNFAKPEPTAVQVYEVKANGDKEHVVSYTPKDWSNDLDGYNVSFALLKDEIKHFIFEATTGTAITFKVNETRPNLTDYSTTNIAVTEGQNILGLFTNQLTTNEYEVATGSSYGFTFNNIFKPQGGGGGGEIPTTINRSVEKVWNDNNNPNRPASVEVQLLKNGQPFESVVLDASNDWSYDWTGLENGPLWSVQEVNVADGYTASVTRSGNTFTITNTLTTLPDPDETIPDENVPTGSVEPGEPLDEFDEPEIPLGDAPATGDNTNAVPFMALLFVAIAGLVITRRTFN